MESRPGFAIPQQRKPWMHNLGLHLVASWVSSDTPSSFRKLSMLVFWSRVRRSQWRHRYFSHELEDCASGQHRGCRWRVASVIVLIIPSTPGFQCCITNDICKSCVCLRNTLSNIWFVFLYMRDPSLSDIWPQGSVTSVFPLTLINWTRRLVRPEFSLSSQFTTIQRSWAQHG